MLNWKSFFSFYSILLSAAAAIRVRVRASKKPLAGTILEDKDKKGTVKPGYMTMLSKWQ